MTRTDPDLTRILAELSRERRSPQPGERHYPHLRDLLDALADAAQTASGTWLDYGSATAPYRELFPGTEFMTADLASATWRYAVDYELGDDGTVPVPDETFDGVLSTQVLEHVVDPASYLGDARRILKPGGRLLLTTHGTWEDHTPVDLWRWTAQGLKALVESNGFAVDRCLTLTCGPRAILHLLLRQGRSMGWPGSGPAAMLLKSIRALDRRWPAVFDHYSDRWLSGYRSAEAGEYILYLAVLVSARRV